MLSVFLNVLKRQNTWTSFCSVQKSFNHKKSSTCPLILKILKIGRWIDWIHSQFRQMPFSFNRMRATFRQICSTTECIFVSVLLCRSVHILEAFANRPQLAVLSSLTYLSTLSFKRFASVYGTHQFSNMWLSISMFRTDFLSSMFFWLNWFKINLTSQFCVVSYLQKTILSVGFHRYDVIPEVT